VSTVLPTTCWADLADRRVGLWGLGTEGRANLALLRSMGNEPVIVDDTPDPTVTETIMATAAGGLEALASCEVVVKSPGISRHRPEVVQLTDAGVLVVGGLGLWLAGVDRSRVLCITGTKGKSTTTAIAAHVARGLGQRVFAGGNLGGPPWDPTVWAASADGPDAIDLWVIETSSYQAADTMVTSEVVAVTSLHPDHLPWHGGDVATYYRDKLSLCTRPGSRLTVASSASPEVVAHAHLLGPEVHWVDATTYNPAWAAPLGLRGDHNLVNANIARACLVAMGVPGADDDRAVTAATADFAGLTSRLTHVATVDGVEFIDDGLSTNVLPTLAALATWPDRRVALIAGGADRGLDYTELGQALADRQLPTLAVTVYATGPAIADATRTAAAGRAGSPASESTASDSPASESPASASTVEVVSCSDLTEAVHTAWQWARPDGVVLLSPAAASFDAFDDYRHRSAVFAQAIDALPTGQP
jgi:UDP-N-acetylmuramoyl-L-alanine---L-glutamate ligase